MENKTNTIVQQAVKSVNWQPYTFADSQTRQFHCNAIVFNNQGTGNVFLNDIYLLEPGDRLSLNSDQNEIDSTIYKISFTAGFVNRLAVFVKINQGSTSAINNHLMKMVAPSDRRKQIKEYYQRRNRGIF